MREPTALPWDIDTFFNLLWSGWERLFPGWLRPSSWDPAVEIAMEGDTLSFQVALSGSDPHDVEVLIVGNQIVVKSGAQATQEQGDGNSFFTRSSRFEHTLPVPDGVNPDTVTARYHDGVLKISMPAPKGIVARRISVEVE